MADADSGKPASGFSKVIKWMGIVAKPADLLDDLLNPIVRSIDSLPIHIKDLVGPLAVSIVSFINYTIGFVESILKLHKYFKNEENSIKQRKVKLTTGGFTTALTFVGILTSSIYFTSLVTSGLPSFLQFFVPMLPLLPGILPGIGLAASSFYLLRKAYVYHESKKINSDSEESKKAQKKMKLALFGAFGQALLFAGMMTMVAVTGGTPVLAGAIIGALMVTTQKGLKYVLDEHNTGKYTVKLRRFLTVTLPNFFSKPDNEFKPPISEEVPNPPIQHISHLLPSAQDVQAVSQVGASQEIKPLFPEAPKADEEEYRNFHCRGHALGR